MDYGTPSDRSHKLFHEVKVNDILAQKKEIVEKKNCNAMLHFHGDDMSGTMI